MILTGENGITWIKTCPSATLTTTNPTWTDPGANLGLCDERPEPSHGLICYHTEKLKTVLKL
jgi:hypothetical protein